MGFGIGAAIANFLISRGRIIGNKLGYQLAVNQNQHSIKVKMVNPDSDNYAWDHDLFRKGNLFVGGYSNPVKVLINHNKELADPDTVDVMEGSAAATDGGTEDADEEEDEKHVEVISSSRYRAYMRQDLISQLLNPREQWKLIMYILAGIGVLQFVTIIVIMWATGGL